MGGAGGSAVAVLERELAISLLRVCDVGTNTMHILKFMQVSACR